MDLLSAIENFFSEILGLHICSPLFSESLLFTVLDSPFDMNGQCSVKVSSLRPSGLQPDTLPSELTEHEKVNEIFLIAKSFCFHDFLLAFLYYKYDFLFFRFLFFI